MLFCGCCRSLEHRCCIMRLQSQVALYGVLPSPTRCVQRIISRMASDNLILIKMDRDASSNIWCPPEFAAEFDVKHFSLPVPPPKKTSANHFGKSLFFRLRFSSYLILEFREWQLKHWHAGVTPGKFLKNVWPVGDLVCTAYA